MESLPAFTLRTPRTIAEAVTLLAAPGARAIAGGTDLVPNARKGLVDARSLVDVTHIPELREIAHDARGTMIGAAVTLARIVSDRALLQAHPVLVDAARAVAAPSHRNVATLGGNLCQDTRCVFYNQSEWWRNANGFCLKHGGDTCHVAPQGRRCHAAFASDVAPALLALGASVVTATVEWTRERALADLYVEDGASHLALVPGEIVVGVRIPPQPVHARTGYRKARTRGAIDFPLAGVAARVVIDEGVLRDVRVALTGTNSRAFLLAGTDALVGRAPDDEALDELARLVRRQASPMRTTVTQANYRRQVAAVMVQRLVRELCAEPRE
jgi:4-hydroxybenzoyl-CoA reductase subunit beta